MTTDEMTVLAFLFFRFFFFLLFPVDEGASVLVVSLSGTSCRVSRLSPGPSRPSAPSTAVSADPNRLIGSLPAGSTNVSAVAPSSLAVFSASALHSGQHNSQYPSSSISASPSALRFESFERPARVLRGRDGELEAEAAAGGAEEERFCDRGRGAGEDGREDSGVLIERGAGEAERESASAKMW